MINDRWVFHDDVTPQDQGNGVIRRVLAYSKDLMCVENAFEKGAVGCVLSMSPPHLPYSAEMIRSQ